MPVASPFIQAPAAADRAPERSSCEAPPPDLPRTDARPLARMILRLECVAVAASLLACQSNRLGVTGTETTSAAASSGPAVEFVAPIPDEPASQDRHPHGSPPLEGGVHPATSRGGATTLGTAPQRAGTVRLIAGGDVNFGQLRGQLLLRDAARDDFSKLQPLLATADLRFVNLESQLSNQRGETVSPINPLVFTGPPSGAAALRRGGIDVVSLANNHAWDYGREAFFETLETLDRASVQWVGAGRDRARASAAVLVRRNSVGVAFVAATHIWNQGPLGTHPAREHVMQATEHALRDAIGRARATDGTDVVVVSIHAGDEYVDTPREEIRALFRAAVRAGADVVLGHHPHVVQRIEIVDGTPIFYSLGNLLMRMVTGQPWTQFGLLARIELEPGKAPSASICPVRIHGLDTIALGVDPERNSYEPYFRARYEALLRAGERADPASSVRLGPFAADGCAPLHAHSARATPPPPGPPTARPTHR